MFGLLAFGFLCLDVVLLQCKRWNARRQGREAKVMMGESVAYCEVDQLLAYKQPRNCFKDHLDNTFSGSFRDCFRSSSARQPLLTAGLVTSPTNSGSNWLIRMSLQLSLWHLYKAEKQSKESLRRNAAHLHSSGGLPPLERMHGETRKTRGDTGRRRCVVCLPPLSQMAWAYRPVGERPRATVAR